MNAKDIFKNLLNGKMLDVTYLDSKDTLTLALIKLDKENGNIYFKDEKSNEWKQIANNVYIWYGLVNFPDNCRICDYPDDYNTAIKALYTEGATITSELCGPYCLVHSNSSYSYHLDCGGTMLDGSNARANILKSEYLGRWHIEYPKK